MQLDQPISILIIKFRHRLKYALNYRETTTILKDKEANVRVDGKIRRDRGYPTGIMGELAIFNQHLS